MISPQTVVVKGTSFLNYRMEKFVTRPRETAWPYFSAVQISAANNRLDDRARDILFVASTADNEIFAIEDAADLTGTAGTGNVVFGDQTLLHGPLGLTLAPNGHLITANGDAPTVNPGGTQNDLVEFTKQGKFVATHQLDSGASGAAFGIASTISRQGAVRFAAVDDDLNAVIIWTLRSLF